MVIGLKKLTSTLLPLVIRRRRNALPEVSATSSGAVGALVPIPNLPLESRRAFSVVLIPKTILVAARVLIAKSVLLPLLIAWFAVPISPTIVPLCWNVP